MLERFETVAAPRVAFADKAIRGLDLLERIRNSDVQRWRTGCGQGGEHPGTRGGRRRRIAFALSSSIFDQSREAPPRSGSEREIDGRHVTATLGDARNHCVFRSRRRCCTVLRHVDLPGAMRKRGSKWLRGMSRGRQVLCDEILLLDLMGKVFLP